jgi:hypothetical protein
MHSSFLTSAEVKDHATEAYPSLDLMKTNYIRRLKTDNKEKPL